MFLVLLFFEFTFNEKLCFIFSWEIRLFLFGFGLFFTSLLLEFFGFSVYFK